MNHDNSARRDAILYGKVFSSVYNSRWSGFAEGIGPLVLDYHERHPLKHSSRRILDVCCGTGQFAMHALGQGYSVVGVDASPHMLLHARRNTEPYVASGKAKFIEGLAEDFEVDQPCDFAVSLFDALNHLPDLDALRQCFVSVHKAVVPGGLFIFDINTLAGLRKWNSISITDEAELLIVNRSLFVEGSPRALAKITGFLRTESGLYERFEEDMFNTVFDLASVEGALRDAGWKQVHIATANDLDTPLSDPEQATRAFFVARR